MTTNQTPVRQDEGHTQDEQIQEILTAIKAGEKSGVDVEEEIGAIESSLTRNEETFARYKVLLFVRALLGSPAFQS
jgi:hypothetical protein